VRLKGGKRIDHLLFVGDDRSDLDAFREATIRIAVNSAEAPRQLIQAADAVVSGPREVIAMLEHLADVG
jgi:soluble P-type ATPase